MDSIALQDTGDKANGVRVLINGRDLSDIVREIELPFALKEDSAEIAGAYSGLPPEIAFLPSRHFFGEADALHGDDEGQTFALVCDCGEPGCWPLSLRVDIGERKVIWSDFRQPHRGPTSKAGHWRYDALPRFTFERKAYEDALHRDQGAV
jgi:hypothetical protein